jgi:hypothetical protein
MVDEDYVCMLKWSEQWPFSQGCFYCLVHKYLPFYVENISGSRLALFNGFFSYKNKILIITYANVLSANLYFSSCLKSLNVFSEL